MAIDISQQGNALVRRILGESPDADGAFEDVTGPTFAGGISRLPVVFVNLYAVETGGGKFVLIDTGLPLSAGRTKTAVAARFGEGARPQAIVLTHAHFDHAGGAKELALEYGCPVYASEREMPYLDGRSDYAPQDPTPGGAICFLSRFFPHSGHDFRHELDLRPLPEDGSIPVMPGWRWIASPGHTAGHVSFFRDSDRTLIAGDAFTTVDLDSWASQVTARREFARPPTPFTPDWASAKRSIDELLTLEPETVCAGHGLPISGPDVPDRLRAFAEEMGPPPHGRYVGRPARYAPDGSLSEVPPPVPDPLKPKLTTAALVAVAGVGAVALLGRRKGK